MGEGSAARAARRVLIADDNRDAADSLKLALELMGHETRAVYDGEEALAVARSFMPDVLLLDIGMPKLNGYATARRISQAPWGAHMRLVALTGWGQADDRRRARDAGFHHHLTKPVDVNALGRMLGTF